MGWLRPPRRGGNDWHGRGDTPCKRTACITIQSKSRITHFSQSKVKCTDRGLKTTNGTLLRLIEFRIF